MALLSSNSVHRVLPDVSHASLIEDQQDSVSASAAIIDVVHAVRSGAPLEPLTMFGHLTRSTTRPRENSHVKTPC